ncbi:hypothetical protein [Arhodomonas sp. AD133]|uniref:hypothetical protein n=1 Tax=Arhodomonas sp. AD133 TaxID=3415009 RepID=UPI003EBC0ABF
MKRTGSAAVVALTAVLALSGCNVASLGAYKSGTQVTAAQRQAFEPGETTRADVVAELGAAQRVKQVGDETHLVYDYSEIRHFGSNINQSTRFRFDSNDTLLGIETGKGPATNPLTQG